MQANYLLDFLDDWGLKSRLVNFYNVPSQGNHTAVEVQLAGVWKLLDPTFGLFFINERYTLASTEEVLNGEAEARALGPNSALYLTNNLSYLGDQPDLRALEDMFWSPENYAKAEAVVPVGLDPLQEVSLRIEVPIDGFFPRPDSCKVEGLACDSEWLDATIKTLLNENPADDVSLLSRNIGEYSPYFVNSPQLYLVGNATHGLAERRGNGSAGKIEISVYFDRHTKVLFSGGGQSAVVQTSGESVRASTIVEVETAIQQGIAVSTVDSGGARILYVETALIDEAPRQ